MSKRGASDEGEEMARKLSIESSTDSKAAREMATFAPYSSVSVTVTAARQPVRRPDGGTEAAEPDVETSSKVMAGRELMENAMEYDRRVQEFRKQQPNFSTLVNQPTEIPVAARDQIFRMRNGPEIALFLSFAPEVCSHLCKMDPVKAAETIEDISDDLNWGNIPTERVSYSAFKDGRNREKAPRARKR
jgi:hypothetical protein